MTGRRIGWLLLAGSLVLGGCATAPRDPAERAVLKANNDPWEPLNRRTFALNLFFDRILIKPVAEDYRDMVAEPTRQAVRHFLDNLNEPVVLINDTLQGRFASSAKTGARFVVNSTAGLAGFADVATRHGLPRQSGDFGQTLSAWGFGEGPYLIIPLFGPSSPRDGIGLGVDLYLDPFRYVARANNYPTGVTAGRTFLDGIDQRERNLDALDEMQREAVDFYASFRSLYRQNRAADLRPGKAAAPSAPPGFYDDPEK
jgi:phospholipid-binding lipoprotein MlaA